MTPARLVTLVAILLVGSAGPAAATTLAAVERPWHYWMAPALAGAIVLYTLLAGLGYVLRVVLARHGIRPGRH